jgi:hypothetical protein
MGQRTDVRRSFKARNLALLSLADLGRKYADPISLDGLVFGSLSAARSGGIRVIEEGSPSVGKAKARSIRAGLWRCVISIPRAKSGSEMLLAGNDPAEDGLAWFR